LLQAELAGLDCEAITIERPFFPEFTQQGCPTARGLRRRIF
jgi:hypothetical protein